MCASSCGLPLNLLTATFFYIYTCRSNKVCEFFLFLWLDVYYAVIIVYKVDESLYKCDRDRFVMNSNINLMKWWNCFIYLFFLTVFIFYFFFILLLAKSIIPFFSLSPQLQSNNTCFNATICIFTSLFQASMKVSFEVHIYI